MTYAKIMTLKLQADDLEELQAMENDVLDLTDTLTTGKTQVTIEDSVNC